MHILLLLGLIVGAKARPADSLHKDGLMAFERSHFDDAAKAFAAELKLVTDETRSSPSAREQDVRQRLALSLYSAGDKAGAKRAYADLVRRFPSFHFDPDQVFPETVQFFEASTPPPEPPKNEIKAAPETAEQPRVVQPPASTAVAAPKPMWKWYYLTPLGIGQFLAGSPVRGTVFLVAELGMIAMNVVGYVLLANQRAQPGSSTVHDLGRAGTAQILMDIGFFGIIGSAVLGALDGAILEP